ncbi:hypothetical protein ABTX24_21365 [Nocardioides sp. NPDC127514]|uniref:hypothetical protein n=1 Tax=unclassified Nocardioides TaxID=2615069 RepID=UPI00332DC7CF
MAGEDNQDTGRDGLHEAKRWLDLTTRVKTSWTHRDVPLSELLAFDWPHGTTSFSFDIGGMFRGDPLDSQSFLAEVKAYKNESDLPTHFRDFLAKCYVAYLAYPDRCGHFLWLSWSPFQAQSWDKHTTPESIQKALLHKENRQRVLGTEDQTGAEAAIDHQAILQVSERLWLLTLARKQRDLVLTRDHYLEVLKLIQGEAV